MGVIFVVSPHYLDKVFQESLKYDFEVCGYGSCAKASDNLSNVNVIDILGFCYFASSLPTNLVSLRTFINKCNLLESNKKFLFILQDSTGIDDLISKCNCNNLKIFVKSIDEFVTDVTINEELFGSILLDNYEPYQFKNEEKIKYSSFPSPINKYVSVFSENTINCLSYVEKLDTVEHTLEYDKIYKHFVKTDNKLYTKLREIFIYSGFFDPNERLPELSYFEDNLSTNEFCELQAIKSILLRR